MACFLLNICAVVCIPRAILSFMSQSVCLRPLFFFYQAISNHLPVILFIFHVLLSFSMSAMRASLLFLFTFFLHSLRTA